MLYLEVSLWIGQEIDDGCTKKDHSSRVDEERRPPAEIAGQESSGETDRPQAAALGRRGAAKGIRAWDFAGNQKTAPAEVTSSIRRRKTGRQMSKRRIRAVSASVVLFLRPGG